MEIQSPVFLQILIDLALLIAVMILIWRVNSNLKKPLIKSHQDMMKDLKEVMAQSQTSSENFLEALEKSRLALKEIALELDLKEKRVKTLLAKSDNAGNGAEGRPKPGDPRDKYKQVVEMIRQGYTEAQTSETTGFTEAEIGLIFDLYRVKNENT